MKRDQQEEETFGRRFRRGQETRAEHYLVRLSEFMLSLTIKTVRETGWRKRPVSHVLFNPDANP